MNESELLESDRLRVSILAMDIAEGRVDENLSRASRMLADIPGDTDLAVLPELFTTSFMRDREGMARIAMSEADRTLRAVRAMAVEFNCAIAGSFIADCYGSESDGSLPEDAPRMVNRGFLVKPDGTALFYDKRHLFCLSPESRLLKSGSEKPLGTELKGWNVSLIVCYDLRFPVWCREASRNSDLLLVPANWPSAREYAWRQLLIARGIENQEYVIGAERSGSDAFGDYDGMSMVVDPLGRPVETRTKATEFGPVISAVLSHDYITTCRRKMPFLNDADSFRVL